ncbi:MAG TPA: hypothetical protein VLB29_04985 [Nocardioidaceae bacterium]|nr:hypothetical protein [Nocardioidaceae bacterium]
MSTWLRQAWKPGALNPLSGFAALIRVVVLVVTFVLTLLRLARNFSGALSDRLRILDVVQVFGGLLQRPGGDRRWG